MKREWHTVLVRLSEEQLEKLRALAVAEDRSMAAVMRRLVEKAEVAS